MPRKLEQILVAVFLAFAATCGYCAESFRIGPDGSLRGTFPAGENRRADLTLRFGMPRTTPAKRWMEGQTLRTLWVTNGIRYTQTVLLTQLPGDTTSTSPTNPAPVLLINIEGENTNSEYADAFATLTAEVGGRPARLEFTNRIVWVHGLGGFALGSLEIPESGVRTAEGEALEFYGGIPPSLKGSMTLKLPLTPLGYSPEESDRLAELEYDAAFRRAVRPGAGLPAGTIEFTPDLSSRGTPLQSSQL